MSLVRNKALWMVRVATVALGVTVAIPAMAQSQSGPVYGPFDAYWRDPLITYTYPGPEKAELRIPVKASVGGQCGFATAPNATRDVGQIDTTPINEIVNFVPECTAPWRIAVSSQNGGLVTDPTATLSSGYLNKAPYTVTLNINNDGTPSPLTASCAVANLQTSGGACDFKGTASTTVGLLVPRSYQLSEPVWPSWASCSSTARSMIAAWSDSETVTEPLWLRAISRPSTSKLDPASAEE